MHRLKGLVHLSGKITYVCACGREFRTQYYGESHVYKMNKLWRQNFSWKIKVPHQQLQVHCEICGKWGSYIDDVRQNRCKLHRKKWYQFWLK